MEVAIATLYHMTIQHLGVSAHAVVIAIPMSESLYEVQLTMYMQCIGYSSIKTLH